MYINPLIALPSPRDFQTIKDALDKIQEYDKLWIKYSPEHVTYPIIREQFLKNKQYTHLVICPDDLLIDDKNKLELLFKDYESFPLDQRDKIILSGYCNVDTSENSKYANVTQYDVSNTRQGRTYQWFTLEELEGKTEDDFLIPVQFAGFPLMVIPRSAIEQIPFKNDSFTGIFDGNGCCVDVMFCNDAIAKGYSIFVDSRVRLYHLKYNDTVTCDLIQKAAKTEKDYTYYYEYATRRK